MTAIEREQAALARADASDADADAAIHDYRQWLAQKSHPRLRVVARRPTNSGSALTLGTREEIRRQNPGERRGPPDPADPPEQTIPAVPHLRLVAAAPTDPELALERVIMTAPFTPRMR